VLGLAGTSHADGKTAEEISECVRGNLPERTSQQQIELESLDRAGGKRKLAAKLDWKRGEEDRPRVRIRVQAPPDLRDAAYLVIEKPGDDDMFMYVPALRKVRRIAGGMLEGELWGTDFSYEDIKQVQGITGSGARERLPDAEVSGRPAWVVEHRPDGSEGSPYTRIVAYVDRATCVALRTEFFQRGERPRKVLVADPESLLQVGGRWLAGSLEMEDLRDETRSWLRVLKVEHDTEIPERVFSVKRLSLGH
jgi:hypothetical protein